MFDRLAFNGYTGTEVAIAGLAALTVIGLVIVYLRARDFVNDKVKSRTLLTTFRENRDTVNARFRDTTAATRVQNGMIARLQDQMGTVNEHVATLQREVRNINRLNHEQQEAIRSQVSEQDRERIKTEALEQWIAAKENNRRDGAEQVDLDDLRANLNTRFEALGIRTNIDRLADVRLRNLLRDTETRAAKDNENEIILTQLEELRQQVAGRGLSIEPGAVGGRIVESGPVELKPADPQVNTPAGMRPLSEVESYFGKGTKSEFLD